MATSGIYTFSPEAAVFCDEAFERCGIDPATLTMRHVVSARRSLDFLFSEWSNKGPHLWTVTQLTQALTESDGTYDLERGTIAILDMVVRRDGIDIPVLPMMKDEYLAIPDKTTEGLPNRFYFDRLDLPTVSVWPIPENNTDVLYFYVMREIETVGAASNTLDIPPRWSEAVAAGLAAKLAVKFAPDRIGPLKGEAASRFAEAKQEDRERAPTQTRVKYSVGLRRK